VFSEPSSLTPSATAAGSGRAGVVNDGTGLGRTGGEKQRGSNGACLEHVFHFGLQGKKGRTAIDFDWGATPDTKHDLCHIYYYTTKQ
jgi:hypothetical protein